MVPSAYREGRPDSKIEAPRCAALNLRVRVAPFSKVHNGRTYDETGETGVACPVNWRSDANDQKKRGT